MIGPNIFAGYCGNDDLTRTVLCEVNGKIFLRTGDLGWLNTTTGQLELRGKCIYQGRRRTERELEDIKSVLMTISTNCIVIKKKYIDSDYLIAYAETKHTNQDLKYYCVARLPLYLVPSVFVALDILSVDHDGKVDRQSLPLPDLSSLSVFRNMSEQPRTEMENIVHEIWCEILHDIHSIPSIYTSFISIEEDPTFFIKLFQVYSVRFQHDCQVTTFLNQPTIAEHARLLFKHANQTVLFSKQPQSLNASEGKSSSHSHFLLGAW